MTQFCVPSTIYATRIPWWVKHENPPALRDLLLAETANIQDTYLTGIACLDIGG